MSPGVSPGRSLAPYFPLPLVGSAVLLAVLILLTPNLLSTGSPSAGSAESQAELIVDRTNVSSNLTHLYLRAVGLVRYTHLALDCMPLNNSTAPPALAGLPMGTAVGGAGLLSASTVTTQPYFAVNATAEYTDASGASVSFTGAWAFSWRGGVIETVPYGSVSGANPTPVAQMPLVLLLAEQPAPGGP